MSDKLPVYLSPDHILMLFENISQSFDAKGYEGAKALVDICDAFKYTPAIFFTLFVKNIVGPSVNVCASSVVILIVDL